MKLDWKKYYKLTKDKPPSKLLMEALKYVDSRDAALDLGSGALKDAKFLIQEGFLKVTAVDKEDLPGEFYKELSKGRFEFVNSSFESFCFLPSTFSLINAQYSLPFLPSGKFENVFKNIELSLKNKGIFTGQFFGTKDEWNISESKMTFLNNKQVVVLLKNLSILKLEELQEDKKTVEGILKHWHVFNIIAQKNF